MRSPCTAAWEPQTRARPRTFEVTGQTRPRGGAATRSSGPWGGGAGTEGGSGGEAWHLTSPAVTSVSGADVESSFRAMSHGSVSCAISVSWAGACQNPVNLKSSETKKFKKKKARAGGTPPRSPSSRHHFAPGPLPGFLGCLPRPRARALGFQGSQKGHRPRGWGTAVFGNPPGQLPSRPAAETSPANLRREPGP